MRLITRTFAWGELGLCLAFLAYFAVLAVLTPPLDPLTRLLPQIILTGAVAVILLQMLSVVNQRFHNTVAATELAGPSQSDEADAGVTTPLLHRETAAIGWMVLYVVMIIVLGSLVAVALVPLLAMRTFSRVSWGIILAVAAGTWLFVYVAFVWLIGVPLPPGLLFDR